MRLSDMEEGMRTQGTGGWGGGVDDGAALLLPLGLMYSVGQGLKQRWEQDEAAVLLMHGRK